MGERGWTHIAVTALAVGIAHASTAISAKAAAAAQGESLERLFVVDLRKKIESDPAFDGSRFELTLDDRTRVLLTDRLPQQRERRLYEAWLEKLSETLDARYFRPLELGRRTSHPVTPILLLPDGGSFEQFLEKRHGSKSAWTPSLWDADLRSVVAVTTPVAWIQRSAVLRDWAFGAFEAHAPRESQPNAVWFRRGLACYLTYHLGTQVAELDRHRPDRNAVKRLFELIRKPERRSALWIPFADLANVSDVASLDRSPRGDDPSMSEMFDIQCALLLHFLHHAEDGRYREGVVPFLGRALAGSADASALEEHFGTRDLADLERPFEDYVMRLFEEIFIGTPDEEELAEPEAPVEVDLSGLTRAASEDRTRVGLALWRARNGRLDEAIAALEAGFSGEPDPSAPDSAVSRNLARLRHLRAARDEYLAAGLASGKRTRLQAGERKVNAVIARVADGAIEFAAEDVPPVQLADIDSVSLALSTGAPRDELGKGWLRAFALALGEDPRWERFLRDDGPAGSALAADIEGRFAGWLAGGRTASALADLAASGVPATPAEARLSATALGDLLAAGPESRAELAPHREALTALARRAYELTFLEEGLQESLGGSLEVLEEGRIRLTYDFGDEAQVADFADFPDYLEWRRETIKGDFPDEPFKLKKDAWRGRGKHCFRHKLRFQAPMRFAYQFTIEKSKSNGTDAAEFLFGICDNGEESWLGCYGQGELHIQNKRLGTYDSIGRGEEPTAFFIKHPHELEIRHDGSRVSTWREGEKRQESPALGLASGYVFVWLTVGSYVRLDDFVIEGTPEPASLRELREAWVTERLATLGFE